MARVYLLCLRVGGSIGNRARELVVTDRPVTNWSRTVQLTAKLLTFLLF